jgi:hypothetical protein
MPDDFVALVMDSEDVTDLIGDRIFPNVVPRQVWDGPDRRPCLSYRSEVDAPGLTFCETDDLRTERFTVACQGFTYDGVRELARAFVAAVLDFSGVSGGSDIDRVTLDFEFDSPDFEPGIYQRIVRVAVAYRSE